MDWSAVIVGGLAFLGTLAGAYTANKKQTAIWAYRLQELEKKVDKHNQVIERTYALEKEMDVVKVKLKETDRRVGDLEEDK